MADLLVDTDVFSFLFRNDSRGGLYRHHLDGHFPAVARMTVAEVYRWTIVHKWGKRRVDEVLESLGLYEILEPDDETSWGWAKVTSIPGRPVAQGDAWIAATALRHNLPLVTHNRRHFEHIPDLQIISESP